MIASLAMYALLVGLLLGALAVVVERGARMVKLPTRFVWAVVMAAMVLVPAAGLLGRSEATPAAPVMLSASDDASPTEAGNAPSLTEVSPAFLSTMPENLVNVWRETLDGIQDSTQGVDGLLFALWATMSAFVLGVTLHALSEARRMRVGLESRTVLGETVLLSEDIGPSAVGGTPATIVIPRWVMTLDESLRSLVIRHEQEHLSARDPALLTTALGLLVLIPWHPVLWWSWRRLRLAIEVDCDARVLRREPNPQKYGQLLLLVSQRRSTGPRGQRAVMSLTAPLSPQASQLKHRIDAMTTRPTKHRRSTIVALAAGVLGASLLIAAVPTPRSNQLNAAGSPLEYRWVARQGGAGVSVLPRRTEIPLAMSGVADSVAVNVTEPFLTLADVDSIMVSDTNDGEATVGAMVSAGARDRLRATPRQRIGSEVAVVVDGAVFTIAKVKSALGGPLPVWTGAAAEAKVIAERLREAQRGRRQRGSASSDSLSAAPTTVPVQRTNVTVSVTNVGTKNVAFDSRGQLTGEILLYGNGPVRVGFGTSEPQVVSDTIRLKTFPAFTADVTSGDVHIELRGDGELELRGTVTGGGAVNLSATGKHIVLVKGGSGIRTIGR
jgi:beta-lactamase regulating signal transducer with metallopeptidase domain